MLILTVLVGYILLVMVLQLLRRRSAQEMELQKKSRRESTRPSWRNRTTSWKSRFSTRERQTVPSGSSCSI